MTDYKRMEWQVRAYKVATWTRIVCVFAVFPEIVETIELHFPWWLDVATPLTILLHEICKYVQRYTRQYVEWEP